MPHGCCVAILCLNWYLNSKVLLYTNRLSQNKILSLTILRYYKFLFPNFNWLDINFWFHLHRPIMIMVPLMSIAAFILILAYNNWNWTDNDIKVNFAHSIFGIVAISVSILQVINSS
jgi:presenilin-like A22 family membrane protease